MGRMVDTSYGPLPGCPECGVVLLQGGPHVCEHGVTPAPRVEVSFTVTFESRDVYEAWAARTEDDEDD